MNIQLIQTNLKKLQNDNLLRFLYDLIINNLQDVDQYQVGNIYNKNDIVYLQENNIHNIYRCIVDRSSDVFLFNEWEYVLDIYDKEVRSVNSFKIKEEVHVITEETIYQITSNLETKYENSTYIIYHGKKRYANNYDFTVKNNQIFFNKPFNPGDRLILEVRETVGVTDRFVLISNNGIKYEIGVVGDDICIFETSYNSSKNAAYIKDIVNGNSYKFYMVDDELYYEVTDSEVSVTEFKLLDDNGKKFKVEMVNNELLFSAKE